MTWIERAWYNRAKWLYLLLPVSWLFRLVTWLRRRVLSRAAAAVETPVPIIIVGNISVGGTGKTPLLIHLCQMLQARGYKPGVISRGYGGQAAGMPLRVDEDTYPAVCGDEPALIFQQCKVPLVIDTDRLRAYRHLVQHHEVDVVIADDGLQHYRLPRLVEIAVIDGTRLFGNGLCLPAGPLRESPARLREVDLLVVNGEPETPRPELSKAFTMNLKPRNLVNLKTGETRTFAGAPFKLGDQVQAVAGIGNPDRFFKRVTELPYAVTCHAFPDHHAYTAEDFTGGGIDLQRPIVMTEKDGIKCRTFATENFWVLTTAVELDADFGDQLLALISNTPHPTTQDANHAG